MDDTEFPPRVDLLRGMVTALVQNIAEEKVLGPNNESTYIGCNRISRFLDRNPVLASKFSTQLDQHMQQASNPITLHDFFNKLSGLLWKLISKGLQPNNEIYNFDKKKSILGFLSSTEVVCRKRRGNSNVAQDGSRAPVAIIEAASSANQQPAPDSPVLGR
jgi:hypothetical protein